MKDADSISEEIRTCAARPEVDDVPWHRLTAAYGRGTDLPAHRAVLERMPRGTDLPAHRAVLERMPFCLSLKDGYPYHTLCLEDGTIVTGRDRGLKKQRKLPLLFEIFCKCSAMASWICNKE